MAERILVTTLCMLLITGLGCTQAAAHPEEDGTSPVEGSAQSSTASPKQPAPISDPTADAAVRELRNDVGSPLQKVGTPVPLDFSAAPDKWVNCWQMAAREVLSEAVHGLIHFPPEQWQAATMECYVFALPVAGPGTGVPASLQQASTEPRAAMMVTDLSVRQLELVVTNDVGKGLSIDLPSVDASGAISWTPLSLWQAPDPSHPIRKGEHTGIDTAWLDKKQSRDKTGWELEDHAWMLINGLGHEQATSAEGRYLSAGDGVRALIQTTARLLGDAPADLVETPCLAGLTLTNLVPVAEETAPILVQFDGVQAYRVRVTLPSGIAYDSVLCLKLLGERYVDAWYSYAKFMHGVGRPVTWTTLGAYDLAPCP